MALSKIVENSIADEAVSSAKLKDFSAAVDLNGVELVLDADADTSITADTDDRIDFKIANTDHISFGTSSGDTVIKAMVDAKDILFQQFDGRTILDINDGGFVGIANGATGPGTIRFFEDTDNGSNYVGLAAGSISSSLTFTLPVADGSAGQFLKTDGSGALSFDTVSSAADDLTTGDAAVTLATSAGNITIDAQGNDTDIIFKGTDGGADTTFLTIDGSAAGAATFNDKITAVGTSVFTNLDISGDIDVDGTTNLDVVDIDGAVDMASTLQVDGSITSSDGMTITVNDNSATLELISTDADAGAGPNIRLYRNSSSPADSDIFGQISFEGRNDANQDFTAVTISTNSGDITDGTEDAQIEFDVMTNGTLREYMRMASGSTPAVVFNEDSQDIDFRVESNGNANMLFVNGGTDKVGIGLDDPTGTFHVKSTDAGTTMYIEDTNAGSGDGPELYLYRNSSSPADNDDIGIMKFLGRNDNSQDVIYGQIKSIITDASDGTEDGKIEFYHMLGGTLTPSLQMTSSEIVINESSNDLDFRVESNGQANMFFVDGGNDRVHFNGTTGTREVNISGDNTRLLLYSTNNSTGAGQLQFGDADNEQIGRIMYEHDGNKMTFHTSATERMSITGDGEINMPGQPCFSATAGQNNISLSTQTTVSLGTERFDVGSNLASNAFTAPVTGKYLLTYMFYFTQLDADHTTLDVHITTSNKQYQQTFSPDHFLNSDSNFSVSGSVIADMDANDTAEYRVYMVGGAAQTDIHSDSQVSGCLLV